MLRNACQGRRQVPRLARPTQTLLQFGLKALHAHAHARDAQLAPLAYAFCADVVGVGLQRDFAVRPTCSQYIQYLGQIVYR